MKFNFNVAIKVPSEGFATWNIVTAFYQKDSMIIHSVAEAQSAVSVVPHAKHIATTYHNWYSNCR